MIQRVAGLCVFAAAWLGCASGAHASCTIISVQSSTISTINTGNYTSSSIAPVTTVVASVTVIAQGNGVGTCQPAVAIFRSLQPPVQMTRQPTGTVGLPYAITVNGSNVLYSGAVATPPMKLLPSFPAPTGTKAVTLTVPIKVTPQIPLSTPASGSYLDPLQLQIIEVPVPGAFTIRGSLQLNISGTVLGSCSLVSASAMSIDFSPQVATGVAVATPQTVTHNINCTATARIKLSGSAMVMTPAASGTAAFDGHINYKATATVGGATATLITNGTAAVSSTSTAESGATGSNVTVNTTVNLTPGKPLLGGSYSSVLHVTVDPAL